MMDDRLAMKPPLGTPLIKGHPMARQLLLCHLFNEGGGAITYDSSLHGNTGTLTNMALNDWVPGQHGNALDFSGTNEHIALGSNLTIPSSGATIVASVYFRSFTDSYAYIFQSGTTAFRSGTELALGQSASTAKGEIRFGKSYKVTSGNLFILNEWHQYAASTSTSATIAYRDGVVFESLAGNAYTATPGASYIGGRVTADNIDAIIEYVYVFNCVLTASEISELAQNPFCMFEQPGITRYVYVAAGGLSIPVARHHYTKNIRV